MSTALALNDGHDGADGATATPKKSAGKKATKPPKRTKAEKQAEKDEQKAEKSAKKAEKKAERKAEKKAAAVAAAAAGQEPSTIGLQSHAQRPTVPPLPPKPVRPALDAVHDAILHGAALQQAERQTADVIASIHEDIAALNIDGSRSITRHLIQHVREHRVNLELDVSVDPRPRAPPPATRRFADDAPVSHKVACELYSQARLLWQPVLVNNGVREWEVGNGRWPGCRKRCKMCWYAPFRRSRYLLTMYMAVICLLSCALALVEHHAVPLAIFVLWLVPGLWTPAVLVKGLCCAACRDTHGVVTLEWRVQTLFWFGLWVLPVVVFFVPIAACRHATGLPPTLRWAAFGASLGSLWLLGWAVHWVETVSKGVNKTSHDRYRQVVRNSLTSSGPNNALEADALEVERVRRWPRRLPYGFAYRKSAIMLDGFFICSVTFLPAVPWAAYLQQLELSDALGLADAVADRLRPDLLFRAAGLLDASAVAELAGVEVPFLHLILHWLIVVLALLAPVIIACFRRRTKEEKELESKQQEEMQKMMEITIKGKKNKKGQTKRPPRTAQPPASVLTHRVLSIGAQTKTVTFFCEMLSFPILFHLLEPFFCTDHSVLAAATNTSCITVATTGGVDSISVECMTGDPSVQCWTLKHMGVYVLPSILVLPSYYMRAVRAPVNYMRKQTVLDLSPSYMVTSLQLKVVLAVAALGGRLGGGNMVGASDELPWRAYVLVAAVEVYALTLLLMCTDGSGLCRGYSCCKLKYSSIVDLTSLNRASLIWNVLHGALAAFLLASGGTSSRDGWTLKALPVEMLSAPIFALCLFLIVPCFIRYSKVRCWCCEKQLPQMVPTLGMHERPELVDYPIVAARWSAYKALLEQGRLEVVAKREAEAAAVAAAEAAKAAAVEAAMKRAAELFSGRRVLRECFVVWKFEAKTYDDTVWQGLLQLGTIDFKTFKSCTTQEARKEYMAEHEREHDLKTRAAVSEKAQGDKQDGSASTTGAMFFSSKWSESLKGATVEISGTNQCTAMQTGQYTSVWCDEPLPSTGKHYWEVRFEQPGAKPGDWTLRDPYFVGVVNHCKVDENGAGFSKGAWGIVPYNDDRALRSDGMDGGAVDKRCRNEHGNVFGSNDRVGVLADMDARPRTLQFYRNRTLIKDAKVSGVAGNVRILACPYNRGMSVSIAFSPPVEKLVRFRADLFAAMKPEAPEGRLAQSIADCELAGVPDTDEEMIEARQMQAEVDKKLRLVAEREEQRRLTVATLGDAGTGAALKVMVDPDELVGEPEPPAWLEEVSDDEDDRDDEPTPWVEEVFELRLSEIGGAPPVRGGAGGGSSGGVNGSLMEFHSLLYDHPAENAAGGEAEGTPRQIEQITLEMVLCKPTHIAQRDDSAGPHGSKESKLGRQRCRCTSRSVRKGCSVCKCCFCKCSCCCGDCCWCCERVDLQPVPKVRVVGVDIATAGGQRFISLLQRIKIDQEREGSSRWLRLGLCRCLSCGCVSRRKALGVDLIEVRFNLPNLGRSQFWLETGWGPDMKRAVAAIKALEGKGKHKCNEGKGIRISRAPLDSVMHLEEALLKVRPSADAAVRAMMRALPGSAVTELRLRRNGLTDSALRSIARGLRVTVLSELYLAHNRIGDNGCIALAAALPGSRLRKVDLSANRVGDDGALALAAVAWRGTSQLQEIMLYDNKSITKVGLSALESACDHRRQLRQRDRLLLTSQPGGATAQAGSGSGREQDEDGVEPLALTDGTTTVGLGEHPRPLLFADDLAGASNGSAPLYVAVAYASTPRHVDGRPVAGSRTLQGRPVLSGLPGAAWDPKYTNSGVQLR